MNKAQNESTPRVRTLLFALACSVEISQVSLAPNQKRKAFNLSLMYHVFAANVKDKFYSRDAPRVHKLS